MGLTETFARWGGAEANKADEAFQQAAISLMQLRMTCGYIEDMMQDFQRKRAKVVPAEIRNNGVWVGSDAVPPPKPVHSEDQLLELAKVARIIEALACYHKRGLHRMMPWLRENIHGCRSGFAYEIAKMNKDVPPGQLPALALSQWTASVGAGTQRACDTAVRGGRAVVAFFRSLCASSGPSAPAATPQRVHHQQQADRPGGDGQPVGGGQRLSHAGPNAGHEEEFLQQPGEPHVVHEGDRVETHGAPQGQGVEQRRTQGNGPGQRLVARQLRYVQSR